MTTRKTSVTIDEQLLSAVQRVLNAKTVRETIDRALREVLRAQARRDEIEALSTMAGMDLDDESVMAGAWHK